MYSLKDFKISGIESSQEDVIDVLHRNWFDIASQYFFVIFVAAVFFLGIYIYPLIFPNMRDSGYDILFFFIQNTFFLAFWVYCYLIWVDYYLDIWIITTERIINIEQKGLFVRRVSTAEYEKIQDITVEVTGFLQTMINFGNVRIQTAGELENIIFRKVSNPYEVKNLLVKLRREKEQREKGAFRQNIK